MRKQAGRQWRGPKPATVVAVIALIAALTGTAVAAKKKIDLPPNSVGTAQLKRKSVTTGKIANNSVKGSKVVDQSLTGEDFRVNALATVPSAVEAAHAGDSNAITGHAASCPPSTTLVRGVCFDSNSNGPAPNLESAADSCAQRGGWLPTLSELYSVKNILNLGTGVGTDQQLTDDIYANDTGISYWTVSVDGTGSLERQEISNGGMFFCVYPLIR
jgi:hypothetical protein